MKLPKWIILFSILIAGLAQYSMSADASNIPSYSSSVNQLNTSSVKPNLQSDQVHQVNINKASAEELAAIPGIGSKKAMAIVEYRDLNGEFSSVDELVNVKGIGPKMMMKITAFISV